MKTFNEIWIGLSSVEKEELASEIAKHCWVSALTVRKWGTRISAIRDRNKQAVVDYYRKKGIETSSEVLFPNHKQL